MYKKHDQLSIDDFVFPYGKLNPKNDWVKLADSIPWDIIEDRYAKKFVKNGHPAYSARIALGSLLIKQRLNCSDEWVVKHITENPYLQYFIGLKEFTEKRPFAPNSMTEFRKRFSAGELAEINELIIGEKDEKHTNVSDDNDDNNDDNNGDNNQNSGTLVVDATCVQQEISYPQDIKLLNDSREKLEEIIDEFHVKSGETKKPRTYRRKTRQDYLNISKSKKTVKKVEKRQEYLDICDRNIVEAKIVLGKRSYGLGLIKMKLVQTTRSAAALSILMMNIVKAALTYLRFWLACF